MLLKNSDGDLKEKGDMSSLYNQDNLALDFSNPGFYLKKPFLLEVQNSNKEYLFQNKLKILEMEIYHLDYHLEIERDISSLKNFIKDLDSENKEYFIQCVSRRLTRQWIKANLKRGLDKLQQANNIIKQDKKISFSKMNIFYHYLKIAKSSIGAAQNIIKYQKIIEDVKTQDLDHHMINSKDIEIGDLLLSYKTDKFLKNNFLSKLVAIASQHQITHASIVINKKNEEITVLTSSPGTKGLKEIGLKIKSGEVVFVLRSKFDKINRKRYIEKIEEISETSKKRPKDYKFSEKKCWSACILGFIYSGTFLITSRNFILPNPFSKAKGYFCSEIIDEIFNELGIYLTTRSNHKSVVGPAELLYSYDLEYKGIYC